jgi:hypothetical protein
MSAAFFAPYIVSISAMLFAASCLMTFVYFVKHLDPPAEPGGPAATAVAFSDEKEVRGKVLA